MKKPCWFRGLSGYYRLFVLSEIRKADFSAAVYIILAGLLSDVV